VSAAVPTDLFDRVASTLSLLIPAGSRILLGFSGGVDSVVLLNLLHQLAPRFSWRLSVIHIHHGISQHADAWADFCAGFCARLAVPLHIEKVDISPLRELGIEAAARSLRHAAFSAQSCDFVALAHHSDDQVETLLLQLLRGAGVKGAGAMPVLSAGEKPVLSAVEGSKKRQLHQLVRPLLHSTRQEILAYAQANKLPWIEDESNADDSYPRNFLRHRLLPLMAEKFPAYRQTLTRSTQHFAEAGELLDDLAKLDAPDLFSSSASGGGIKGEGGSLQVSCLQALSRSRAKNLLRYFLYQLGAPMPQLVQMDDMLQQLCLAREDATVCISFAGAAWQVRRYQGRVYALPALAQFDRSQLVLWQGETELAWPALNVRVIFKTSLGQGLSVEKLQGARLTLQLRQGGERLRPSLNASTRTLKNLSQERGIPPWQRDRLPLLFCGEQLVCVPGVAIAAAFQAAADEAGVLMSLACVSD